MKKQDEAIKQTFIAMHIQGTLDRLAQLRAMGLIQTPAKPAQPEPAAPPLPADLPMAPITLRGETKPERRVEKYVVAYRHRTGKWPQINRIVAATHICAADLVGHVLNSNVLDYTVPADMPKSDMDPVMQWSIELK